MTDLPDLYFRITEAGATVYRVVETRQSRLEMTRAATVNIRTGAIKPQGDAPLSPQETVRIDAWIASRRQVLSARARDDVERAVEHLNLLAHWAQSKATDAEVAAAMQPLLLAMHDLRGVLVRRKANSTPHTQDAPRTQDTPDTA